VRRYDADDAPNALAWRSNSTLSPESCPASLDEAWNCVVDIEGGSFSALTETRVLRSAQKFMANRSIAIWPTRLLSIRVHAPGELHAEFWCNGCLARQGEGGCGRRGIHVVKTRFTRDRGVDRVEWERHCPAVHGPGSAQRGFENIDSEAAAVLMREHVARGKLHRDEQHALAELQVARDQREAFEATSDWRDTRAPNLAGSERYRKRKREVDETMCAMRAELDEEEARIRQLRQKQAWLLASAARLSRGE
jgi:hypothetical protein